VRWQYRDPALVWLFVAAYGAHLLEEFFGGFPEWVGLVIGRPLPVGAFLVINGVAIVLMIAAVRAAARREAHGWMAIAIATIAVINGAGHLIGAAATGTYAPGMVTGVVLYLPLGQLLLVRAWHQATGEMFSRGVVAGIAIHALVVLVAAIAATIGR
jgi:hypothetical protein